jgi:biotin carboxylase
MNVLLVGHHASIARLLTRATSGETFFVSLLEEPSIADRRLAHLHLGRRELGGVVERRSGAYHQDVGFLEVVERWARDVRFDAVIPGREYGVPAAYDAARMLGLPHTAEPAIRACTDKLALREMEDAAGLPKPWHAEVTSCLDIDRFTRKRGALALKPANRHASLGVAKVDADSDAGAAWRAVRETLGPWAIPDRDLKWRYLVEEWLDGQQVSVETLVVDGSPIFHSTSLMEFEPERSLLEIAVTVPAPLTELEHAELIAAQESFIGALRPERGIFHAEWRLTSGGPRLLECAARMPGGMRPEQIMWSWGFNICAAFAEIMAGECPAVPLGPRAATTVRTLYPPPGVVTEIAGVDLLDELPGVVDVRVNVGVGDIIPEVVDPYHFALRYLIVEPDADRARAVREHLDRHVAIRTA